jgi:hypothetical protein
VLTADAARLQRAVGSGDVGERVHRVHDRPHCSTLDVRRQVGEQLVRGIAAEEADPL